MKEEAFAVGNTVVFADGKQGEIAVDNCIKQFGPGPFSVTVVEEVPIVCAYCGTDHEPGAGYPRCRPLRMSVGHSQWLTITTQDGRPVEDTGHWSGAWFKKIERA